MRENLSLSGGEALLGGHEGTICPSINYASAGSVDSDKSLLDAGMLLIFFSSATGQEKKKTVDVFIVLKSVLASSPLNAFVVSLLEELETISRLKPRISPSCD
ncbi:hypothetical protein RRG08_028602 [Elysia crispata]|uniref:Uncharacterized protein n=1 Tax=Elysia crispata TaxID=231223 RepID=A0AAE1DLD4_9GAST|nr:hypothetical protein RRG08_028602 [Elysia crispata]